MTVLPSSEESTGRFTKGNRQVSVRKRDNGRCMHNKEIVGDEGNELKGGIRVREWWGRE